MTSSLLSKLLLFWFGVEVGRAFSFSSIHAQVNVPKAHYGRGRMNKYRRQHQPRTMSATSLAFFQRDNYDKVAPEEETEIVSKDSLPLMPNLFKTNDASPSSSPTSSSTKSATTTIPDENDGYMGDLVKFLRNDQDTAPSTVLDDGDDKEKSSQSLGQIVTYAISAVITTALVALSTTGNLDVTELSLKVQSFFADPMSALEAVVTTVESMGPMGYVYFGAVYTVAEILAIPAIPLTASAGYLFGVRDGTAVVLLSASIAAAVSFIIGRSFLRSYVEELLEDYPEFQKIDKAIGKEGFKLMLLLRISPIFPFALSNYLYGVTSIRFWPFFWGTMLGFTPGTIAYVFTGEIGKSLTLESAASTAQPWYVYAGALALLSGFIKVASDVATGIIEEVQQQGEEEEYS